MEPRLVCDTVPEFQQDRSLVWVEYPGIVNNVDKMLKTLGGQKHISNTFQESKKRLDLRFRPDDPCCYPVCGDRTPAAALLLNVKKYRRKKKPGDTSKPDEFRYVPEIVGVVEESYKFSALCDFQYLPLHNDVENDTLVNMLPHLQVKDLDESIYTRDVPLFLPPATFSRFDQQQDVLFRNDPKYKRPRITGLNSKEIGMARPKRIHFAQYIKFEDDWTPKEPLPEAKQSLERLKSEDSVISSGIKELFQERPVWSKNALVCKMKCNHERLKNILPGLAYYFITGPWRSLWVKFGYDPRQNVEAADYQLLDFRVRQGWNTPNIPIQAKRSSLSYHLPNLMPRSHSQSNSAGSLDEQSKPLSQGGRNLSEAVYIYKPGVLPAYRQTFYQVCDIQHPEVVEIVKNGLKKLASSSQCNPKSGWFQEDIAAKIRDILSNDIQDTIALTNKVRLKDMGRDGRKRGGNAPRKVDDNRNEDESTSEADTVSSITRGEVDSDSDEESSTAILDSLLEEEDSDENQDGDDEFEDLVVNEAGEEVGANDEDEDQEIDEASGGLYDGDLDDLEHIMENFEAFSSENLLRGEIEDNDDGSGM